MRASRVAPALGCAAIMFGVAAMAGESNVVVAPNEDAIPDVDYVLRLGLTHSDNVFRAPAGLETASGAVAAGIELNGQRETGRLTYNADVNLIYQAYFEDIPNELNGGAVLEGAYELVPDTLLWNGLVQYGQGRANFSEALAPGNIDDQLTWSTGPELHLRLGRAAEAQLEAHYQAVSYSESISDNSTIGGRALIGRRANPRSYLAIGGSYDKVSYSDELFATLFDYDRSEVFGRFEHSSPRSGMDAEIGYSTVSGENIDDSGPLFRGNFFRRITPTLDGYLSYVHEYPTSQAPTSFQDPTVPGGGVVDDTLLTAAPRVADTMSASLVMQRPRTQARLAYFWRKEESLAEALGTRESDELRFFVSRRFTPKAEGAFYASQMNERFTTFNDDAKETTLGAQLSILFGGSLGLDVRLQYRDRNAEDSANSSEEFQFGLFFRYAGGFGRRTSLGNEEDIGLK